MSDGAYAADPRCDVRELVIALAPDEGLEEPGGLVDLPDDIGHLSISGVEDDIAVPLDPGQVLDMYVDVLRHSVNPLLVVEHIEPLHHLVERNPVFSQNVLVGIHLRVLQEPSASLAAILE